MWFILAALIRLGPPVQTIPPPARMQQPLQELIRTEVVYPQEKHETQITVASAIDRHRDARAFSVPLHLEHGLSDSWQIEAEWTPYVREVAEDATVQGTGDVGFGSKYSFMQIRGSNLHAAVGMDVERALERDAAGETRHAWSATPFLAAAFDLPRRVQLFAQVGANVSVSGEHASTTAASDTPSESGVFENAGALIAFHHVTLATEFNWVPTSDGHAVYVTPSITTHPGHGCELGLGVSAGLNSSADRYTVVVQFIFEK